MTKRVCVFVDGENFRHSIVDLFDSFRSTDYLPKKANWNDFFNFVVSKAVEEGERVRTYWYVIQLLDHYPYKFPDHRTESEKLKRLLSKDEWSKGELAGLTGSKLTRRMQKLVEQLLSSQERMRVRFDGWRKVQDGISSRWSRIEFRRAGAIKYDVFRDKLGSEKAVDVKLATDMIVLRDIYDVAVIVSGDQDYVPAVQVVKDFGKIVINVVFRTRGGKLLPGGARRLNQLTDSCLSIDYKELLTHLNIPS